MEQSFDIDALLHPSRAFRHPLDVVRDTDMTAAEKRSVLASWASDACAIESNPALRATATGNVVNYDDIIDALQSPDAGAVRGRGDLRVQAPASAQTMERLERPRTRRARQWRRGLQRVRLR